MKAISKRIRVTCPDCDHTCYVEVLPDDKDKYMQYDCSCGRPLIMITSDGKYYVIAERVM